MNSKSIQSKMKSIKGVGKITKTMELVSVAKMRKSVIRVNAGRAYEVSARKLLEELPGGMYKHPYYVSRQQGAIVLVVIIGSDKGLCGAYNAQLLRALVEYKSEIVARGLVLEAYTIGKTSDNIARKAGVSVIASFGILPETFDAGEVGSITHMLTSRYLNDTTVKKIIILSQKVERGVSLTVSSSVILPLSFYRPKRDPLIDKIVVEPSPLLFLQTVVPGLIEALLVQAILEARAAEHTARMVAMKNATDNATSYYKELQRTYNKARQAAITQEISEIVGGAASLE